MAFHRLTTLAALTAAASLSAQCRQSEGIIVGAPMSMSMAEGGSFAPDEMYFKPSGLPGAQPTTWAPPGPVQPGFRLSDAFQRWGARRKIDVDALSTGEDWVIATATGVAQMPPNRWGALTVSVRPGARGRAGSEIEAEVASNGAHSDLFSWTIPGSSVPPEFFATHRATDNREMRLGNADDIDALDVHAPLFGLEPNVMRDALAPKRIYFSVSNAAIPDVPAAWWGNTPRSGATIFIMMEASTGQGYTMPRVWKTFREFGLRESEDIDAIAIDERNCHMLFSTRHVAALARNQLLYFNYCTDMASPVPYTTPANTNVTDDIGLLIEDDVDAVCALDPSLRGHNTGRNGIYYGFGTPRPKVLGAPGNVTAQSYRQWNGAVESVETFVSGWPWTGQGAGFAGLIVSFPNWPGNLPPIAAYLANRNPANPICGDPIYYSLPIPPVLALQGRRLEFQWVVANQALTAFTDAHPIWAQL